MSYRDYQMSVILEMAQKAHRPPIHWDKMLRNCEDRRPGIKERQTLMEKAYVSEKYFILSKEANILYW